MRIFSYDQIKQSTVSIDNNKTAYEFCDNYQSGDWQYNLYFNKSNAETDSYCSTDFYQRLIINTTDNGEMETHFRDALHLNQRGWTYAASAAGSKAAQAYCLDQEGTTTAYISAINIKSTPQVAKKFLILRYC